MRVAQVLQKQLSRTAAGMLIAFLFSFLAHPKRTLDDIFIGMF